MFRGSTTLGICLLAVGLLATPSPAVVIDFQSLELVNSGTNSQGGLYSEDGYSLSESGASFATLGTLESRYSGSTALLSDAINGVITLSKEDGGIFALQSIDLTELVSDTPPADITFTGQLSGGGTTMETFTLDGIAFVPETFSFNSSFDSVTSVSWVQFFPFHQFDNIVVIPDPASVLGDFDGDTDVDGFDFLNWQRGESPNLGNADDLADWESNFGAGAGPLSGLAAGASTIPEPSSAVLLSLALAGLVIGRRRFANHLEKKTAKMLSENQGGFADRNLPSC